MFEINIDAPSLFAVETYSCRCRGGLTSSRLCEKNDSFQWPVAFKIFLMCVNMNKAGFRNVALPQLAAALLCRMKRLWTPLSLSTKQYPKINTQANGMTLNRLQEIVPLRVCLMASSVLKSEHFAAILH